MWMLLLFVVQGGLVASCFVPVFFKKKNNRNDKDHKALFFLGAVGMVLFVLELVFFFVVPIVFAWCMTLADI